MAGQGPGNKIDECLAEHSAGAVVIWMEGARVVGNIDSNQKAGAPCRLVVSCASHAWLQAVAIQLVGKLWKADLLSPAADVSSSFTSLEEHCGENST